MSRGARISGIAALVLLVAIGVAFSEDARVLTRSTFGARPEAHGVLYDTLAQLGLAVSRGFEPPARLAPGATVWWIEPPVDLLHAPEDSKPSAREAKGRERFARSIEDAERLSGDALAAWIEAGGTAVVLIQGLEHPEPLQIAGFTIPARRELFELGTRAEGEAPATHAAHAEKEENTDDGKTEKRDFLAPSRSFSVTGAMVAKPRNLSLQWPVIFAAEGDGFREAASANGEPFVLERAHGSGRLVVVADATFLANRWLPRADSAPLALDLVRVYGVPRFDERAHGIAPPRSALRMLARSWAAPFFAGVLLCGLAFAWLGGALPRRAVGDAPPPAPTLDSYVASLAAYYGANREHARIFERYGELTARRLRRALALPTEAPFARVLERARNSGRARAEALELLAGEERVRDARALASAVERLDALVRGVAR